MCRPGNRATLLPLCHEAGDSCEQTAPGCNPQAERTSVDWSSRPNLSLSKTYLGVCGEAELLGNKWRIQRCRWLHVQPSWDSTHRCRGWRALRGVCAGLT